MALGLIGAGSMAQAIIKSALNSGCINSRDIWVSAPSDTNLISLQEQGLNVTNSNIEVVVHCRNIILAVKPAVVLKVAEEICHTLTTSHLVVSIVTGVTIEALRQYLRCPERLRIIRAVPNTPLAVGAGIFAFTRGDYVFEDDISYLKQLMSNAVCEEFPEKLLNAFTGLCGSGPAYLFLVAEALADGAVKMGIPRQVANKLAAQTMIGAGKMIMTTEKHPGLLKDEVCSPGGTTIEGIHELEKAGVRAAMISAVEVSAKKAQQLG